MKRVNVYLFISLLWSLGPKRPLLFKRSYYADVESFFFFPQLGFPSAVAGQRRVLRGSGSAAKTKDHLSL